jgi:transposase-like protein
VRNMHGHCRPAQRGLVSAALREVFNAPDRAEADRRLTDVLARLAAIAPKVCQLLETAEEDLLAFMAFASEHWSKLRSTNPLERVNREIGRRSDVVGISPNDTSAISPRRRSADQAKRRVDRLPPLPLRRIHAPDPLRRDRPRRLSLPLSEEVDELPTAA